jgi:hypothetical protein
MWLDLAPTIAILVIVAAFVRQHRGAPVLQIHALIAASYLNIFPALDYLFSAGLGMSGFARFQLLVGLFFQIPLLLVMHRWAPRISMASTTPAPSRAPARLSPWLPAALAVLLAGFWVVAIEYDLFFRRLGHDALQRASAEVPAILLYVYRGAVETAFFVIVFLWTLLRSVTARSRHYRLYRLSLLGYVVTFMLFFAANSRMQFVLLLLCLICTQPRLAHLILRRFRVLRFVLLLAVLVFGLTLLRELVLEENERIDASDLPELLMTAGWLIAARLDALAILYRLDEIGFNPFGFDLSGIAHVLTFYWSFFLDPALYNAIKESLITSPSVAIVNRILPTDEIDFPKAMILDMFLSFGVLGLLATAAMLGGALVWVQRRVAAFRTFTPGYMVAIYSLPMLLEFEKEFIGLFFAFMKWIPALLLVYLLRPRFAARTQRAPQQVPAPGGSLA